MLIEGLNGKQLRTTTSVYFVGFLTDGGMGPSVHLPICLSVYSSLHPPIPLPSKM